MAKTSKMTANRLTVSRTLHSSVATHGDEIAEALTLALFPKGAPAKLTVAGVLGAIGGLLERVDGKVAAADLAHVAELSDDDAVRVARDGSEQALRQKLLRQRDLILGTYGPAVAQAYGLDETMPVTPSWKALWMPWKWIVWGWVPALTKWTRSCSPSLARKVGPGTWPL